MWEIFYGELKQWSGAIIALIGLIVGIPILRRKLLERHISDALSDIQKTNKQILIEVQKCIDTLTQNLKDRNKVDAEFLKDIQSKINSLYLISLSGSSECQTLLYYLKAVVYYCEDEIKSIEGSKQPHILKSEFSTFVNNVLYAVIYFASQAVPVPKSGKLKQVQFIQKRVAQFVSDPKVRSYKHFRQGYIFDPSSSIYMSFISDAINVRDPLIMLGTYRIYNNNDLVGAMLVKNKMYAPLELTGGTEQRPQLLNLIGFHIYLGSNEVKLHYANVQQGFKFVESMMNGKKTQERLDGFSDSYIFDSGFEISSRMMSENHRFGEVITLTFDGNYLNLMYRKNRGALHKRLRKSGLKFLLEKHVLHHPRRGKK